jgi:hypothetical protein
MTVDGEADASGPPAEASSLRAAGFMAEMAAKLGNYEDAELFSRLSDDVRNAAEDTYWIKDKGFYAVKVATGTWEQHLQPYEDVNTMPGMTDTSLLPKAANYAGIVFEDLVERILLGASLKVECVRPEETSVIGKP